MQTNNFTATLLVDQTPEEVSAAINDIRGWWCEDVEGNTGKLGDEFWYRDKHLRAKMKITELVSGRKIVWHVLESQMDDIEDGTEWNDTKLVFEITREHDKTKIRFTHLGLVPEFECYTVCSKAWDFYIKSSLQRLITTSKGEPIKKE